MQNGASKRKSWDDYFMDIAMVATSPCDRARRTVVTKTSASVQVIMGCNRAPHVTISGT